MGAIYASDQKFQFAPMASLQEPEKEILYGFEVYYKLFPLGLTPEPPTSYNSVGDMLADSYKRFNNPGLDTPNSIVLPLIPVNPYNLTVWDRATVDFSSSVSNDQYPKITITKNGTPVSEVFAARRVVVSLNEFKRFIKSQFESSDSDVTAQVYSDISTGGSDGLGSVDVSCFAFSWGFDPKTSAYAYSEPVYLGKEKIAFPSSWP